MLIFTHLDERPEWLDANEPSPLEQVEEEAERILGPRFETYRETTDESRLPVPQGGRDHCGAGNAGYRIQSSDSELCVEGGSLHASRNLRA
jgi:hypothetical protein